MDRRNFLKTVSLLSLFPFIKGTNALRRDNLKKEILEIFEISESDIEKIVKKALINKSSFSELYLEYSINSFLKLEDGDLKEPSISIKRGAGVRVISGEKIGYSYTESFEIKDLLKIADTSASLVKFRSKSFPFHLKHEKIHKRFYPQDVISGISPKTKTELLQRGFNKIKGEDDIIKISAFYSDSLKLKIIANSEGLLVYDYQPLLRYNVEVIAEKKGVRVRGYEGGGGRAGVEYFDKNPPEKIAEEALRQALVQLEASDGPAGEFEVVLASGDSGVLLHESIGHPLEGDFNRKKTSAFTDRIGEKVACEECTIVDSGQIENSRGSINIDDEGNPSKTNILIEKGILRGYMHDKISSRYFSVEPTGNGRRESYEYYPIPRMTNTYMAPGKYAPEEIIKSTKKGIYVKSYSGGEVDISSGDFVFKATEAYLIEKGKITKPIKGVTLIGNGPKILTKISMVGNDLEFSDGKWTCGKDGQSVPVGVGIPTIKISKLTVGGTKEG